MTMVDKAFAKKLVAKFGSPLYVYDAAEVERRAKQLRSALPTGSTLFYSFKANPLPALASILRDQQCRAEISSVGELNAALAAGFSPSDMLYSSPGKTESEIHTAVAAGVKTFSCESWHDLERLAKATFVTKPIRILLRINPKTPLKAKLAMAGVSSQFGFEEDDLLAGADRLKALDHLEFAGLHIYYGTQISEVSSIILAMENALETAERLSLILGLTFQIIDLGGGFPWPYAVKGEGPDLDALKTALTTLSQQRQLTASAELWFESGRYLIASSGTLLSTVLAIKVGKEGKKYIILDAGINNLGGMSGLGRILRPLVAIEQLDTDKSHEVEVADIVGPLCTPLDCLVRNAKVPKLTPGEVVTIPNVGAYGLTASLTGFLSRPAPVEIVYRHNECVSAYHLRTGHESVAF
jgi:diaminopimelate decarboxylase